MLFRPLLGPLGRLVRSLARSGERGLRAASVETRDLVCIRPGPGPGPWQTTSLGLRTAQSRECTHRVKKVSLNILFSIFSSQKRVVIKIIENYFLSPLCFGLPPPCILLELSRPAAERSLNANIIYNYVAAQRVCRRTARQCSQLLGVQGCAFHLDGGTEPLGCPPCRSRVQCAPQVGRSVWLCRCVCTWPHPGPGASHRPPVSCNHGRRR